MIYAIFMCASFFLNPDYDLAHQPGDGCELQRVVTQREVSLNDDARAGGVTTPKEYCQNEAAFDNSQMDKPEPYFVCMEGQQNNSWRQITEAPRYAPPRVASKPQVQPTPHLVSGLSPVKPHL